MNAKLQGEVTLIFIRSGVSKNENPYLMLSNGRKEFFVSVEESDLALFKDFKENDEVTLEVEVLVGSDSLNIVTVHKD